MRKSAILFTLLWAWLRACTAAFAQRPSNPALLIPQEAPALDYVAVADPLPVPEGVVTGASSSVAFDSKGHLFVLSRGAAAITEFDENGKFIRAFGEGLFTRSHGLRIDKDGNLWTTDVGAHTVMKLSPKGEVLLTLGTKGKAGVWDEAAGTRLLNEPNDIAIRRQRRHLHHAGAFARTWKRRSARSEVRQERELHQDLGRERNRAREV